MPGDPATTGEQLVPVTETAKPFTKAETRAFTDSSRADLTGVWAEVVEADGNEC
jgi:hypothetical protein